MEKVINYLYNIHKYFIIGTVGKTTIISRYIKGKYIKINERTVNTTSSQKIISVNGIPIQLNIWDTAGEEKYHALAPIFYHKSDGAIIVYDCSKKETFERAEKWFTELNELSESNPRIILVGNKIDLPDKKVTTEEGQYLAQKYNANFFEISALIGNGIDTIFEDIANKIYSFKLKEKQDINNEGDNYNIQQNKRKKKIIISGKNERYEKRNNESTSCVC